MNPPLTTSKRSSADETDPLVEKLFSFPIAAIGTLWEDTTALFYLMLVKMCREKLWRTPHIIIGGLPFTCEMEREAIKEGFPDKFRPILICEAQILEKTWAKVLIVLCNSVHAYAKDIQDAIKIPFLSIVDVACEHVQKLRHNCVWVVGTSITKEVWLYRKPFEELGIQVIEPTDREQASINNIIHRLVNGKHTKQDLQNLMKIIQRMKDSGAQSILLACTDLQIIIKHNPENDIHDTMRLLADRCLELISQSDC